MLGADDRLGDGQRPLEEGLGLGILAAGSEDDGQGREAPGDRPPVGPELRLADGQGPPCRLEGIGIFALAIEEPGEAVEALGQPRIVGPQRLGLADRRAARLLGLDVAAGPERLGPLLVVLLPEPRRLLRAPAGPTSPTARGRSGPACQSWASSSLTPIFRIARRVASPGIRLRPRHPRFLPVSCVQSIPPDSRFPIPAPARPPEPARSSRLMDDSNRVDIQVNFSINRMPRPLPRPPPLVSDRSVRLPRRGATGTNSPGIEGQVTCDSPDRRSPNGSSRSSWRGSGWRH